MQGGEQRGLASPGVSGGEGGGPHAGREVRWGGGSDLTRRGGDDPQAALHLLDVGTDGLGDDREVLVQLCAGKQGWW